MSITIQGYKFDVPEGAIAKFAVGYVIADEGEASALRQTKLENLRNNFAPKVKVALNGSDTLSDEQIATLQGDFNAYAHDYKFNVRGSGEGRVRVDPLTREMLTLAKDDFRKAYLAKFNEKPEADLVTERAGELIEKRRDDYMKRAKAIMKQRETAATDTLESLGL